MDDIRSLSTAYAMQHVTDTVPFWCIDSLLDMANKRVQHELSPPEDVLTGWGQLDEQDDIIAVEDTAISKQPGSFQNETTAQTITLTSHS